MAQTHDSAYKQLFSHPEMVRDLLNGFAPYGWTAGLGVEAFERVNASYVGGNGEQRFSDMVWRLHLGGEWLYVYLLLEFQSQSDPWMALRMQVYVGLLYQDLVRQRTITTQGKLPPVLPIVLYNGNGRWTGSTDMAGLILPPPQGLLALQPEQRYLLIDQSSYGNAELAAQANLAAALFRLERSRTYQDSRRVIANLVVWLRQPQYAALRLSFAQWIAGRLKHQLGENRRAKTGDVMAELMEVDIMVEQKFEYWEDMWENEAIEKGMAKGLEQGLKKGLEQGRQEGKLSAMRAVLSSYLHKRFGDLPGVVLSAMEQAELPQIEQWLAQAYDAKQLPDLFENQ